MKRLDINITDRLHDALEELKHNTERSKTELVHDAVAFLVWAVEVNGRGHTVGEVDPSSNTVVSRFTMPMLEQGRRRSEDADLIAEANARLEDLLKLLNTNQPEVAEVASDYVEAIGNALNVVASGTGASGNR